MACSIKPSHLPQELFYGAPAQGRHMFSPFSPFHMPEGPAIRRGGNFGTEFPLAEAYVFLFFAISYAGRISAPALQELFYVAPALGRHMFFSFSPFHMPEGLLPRPCRSFFTELLLRASIYFCLFRRFICRSTFVPCRGIVFGRRFGLLWRIFLEKRLILRHFAVDFIDLTW